MTRWPVYCGAHPDLYNMTSNREAVEPKERWVGGELCERKHVYRAMSSYDPARNNALSSASVMNRGERIRNRIKMRTFAASMIAIPFPSTHTYHFNSVQHKNPSK